MYVLILTALTFYNGVAMTVTQVPNFTSAETCTTAGNAWIAATNQMRDIHVSAVCVKQ